MSLSIRQQRQLIRRQRRQQRRAQRQIRRRAASPHLSRRVRSSDIHSLDERQRHIAQAILRRRQQAQALLDESRDAIREDAALADATEPSSESEPTELSSSKALEPTATPKPEQ